MVDQLAIQRKVSKGYARAARKVGAPVRHIRPASLKDPLASPCRSAMADFSATPDFGFRAPPLWDKPTAWAMMDTEYARPGDLIVAATGTYFVSRFEPWRPVMCVLTNTVISLTETAQSGSGATDDSGSLDGGTCSLAGLQDPYGTSDDSATGQTVGASGWPAYIGPPKRGLNGESGVPGAVRAAEYVLLLPLMPRYIPRPYMLVTDAKGISYTINGCTTSQYGSECLMAIVQA